SEYVLEPLAYLYTTDVVSNTDYIENHIVGPNYTSSSSSGEDADVISEDSSNITVKDAANQANKSAVDVQVQDRVAKKRENNASTIASAGLNVLHVVVLAFDTLDQGVRESKRRVVRTSSSSPNKEKANRGYLDAGGTPRIIYGGGTTPTG
ncbi:unnamed protein product, partial [Amoebophrya sp. A25]